MLSRVPRACSRLLAARSRALAQRSRCPQPSDAARALVGAMGALQPGPRPALPGHLQARSRRRPAARSRSRAACAVAFPGSAPDRRLDTRPRRLAATRRRQGHRAARAERGRERHVRDHAELHALFPADARGDRQGAHHRRPVRRLAVHARPARRSASSSSATPPTTPTASRSRSSPAATSSITRFAPVAWRLDRGQFVMLDAKGAVLALRGERGEHLEPHSGDAPAADDGAAAAVHPQGGNLDEANRPGRAAPIPGCAPYILPRLRQPSRNSQSVTRGAKRAIRQ